MAAPVEASVGYAHLDAKGRLPLAKTMREALGLTAGSVVAYVRVGEGLLLIPQDSHLADLMEAAAAALERSGTSVEEVIDDLPRARDEVVVEHYGASFLENLERTYAAGVARPGAHEP